MVLKIYGHASSTATQRVLVVAKELGIPVEVVAVALRIAQDARIPQDTAVWSGSLLGTLARSMRKREYRTR